MGSREEEAVGMVGKFWEVVLDGMVVVEVGKVVGRKDHPIRTDLKQM